MRLFEFVLDPAAPDDLDLLGDRCWGAGAAGLWEAEGGDGRPVLRAGVEDDRADAFTTALADRRPHDITGRDVVDLSTREVEVGPPGARVRIAVPPTVFGDGDHPTTATCLDLVADLVGPGRRVLDVGCGSGALAVVAAALGSAVRAIDIDADAVAATLANASANGVVVDASTTPLRDLAGVFDVVVANITADPLLALGHELRARVAAGGTLVLSGIWEPRWPEIEAAFGPSTRRVVVDGWVSATFPGPEAD